MPPSATHRTENISRMENIVVDTPLEVAVSSVDLAQLPIGSRVTATHLNQGYNRHKWKLTIIDRETSDWLLEASGKDPARYIGVAQQLDYYKADEHATTRVIVSRHLHQGIKWETLVTGYLDGEVKEVKEMAEIDELSVLRQEIPQPPLDVINLPIGTCVEVMTTGSMLWFTVMPQKPYDTRGPYDKEDYCRVLVSSNSRSFSACPPGRCSSTLVVGQKFFAAGFGSSNVVSYRVL